MNKLFVFIVSVFMSGCLSTDVIRGKEKSNPRIIEVDLLKSNTNSNGEGISPFSRPTPGLVNSSKKNKTLSRGEEGEQPDSEWLKFDGLSKHSEESNNSSPVIIPFGETDTITPEGTARINSFIKELAKDNVSLNQRIKITSSTNVLDRRDHLNNEVISVFLSENISLDNIDVYTQPNSDEARGDFVVIERISDAQ